MVKGVRRVMEKLTIDRSKWLRGEGAGDSYLLRERDGKMCCLGFWCLVKGLTAEQITGRTTPSQIPNVLEAAPSTKPLLESCCSGDAGHFADSDLCNALTETNDAQTLTEAAREAQLTEQFRDGLGVTITFVN